MNAQSNHAGINGSRYLLVDALRGVAAFAVLCHHLLHNSALEAPLTKILPAAFATFCHDGAFGVEIFFVLSGFVIAHSLRGADPDFRSAGRFLVRRQLRLDPPYWTVVFLALLAHRFEMQFSWIVRTPAVGFADTLKNLFYLQGVAGAPQILSVAWTLCLEVQFYIVFILLLIAGKYLGSHRGRSRELSAGLVVLLGVVSIMLPRHALYVWFIQWWYYFAAGALCYWAVTEPKYRLSCAAFLVLFFIRALTQDPLPMLTGFATVALLFTAGLTGNLTRWLDFPVLQYLGRISYSLYLVHLLVAVYVLRLGFRLTGSQPLPALIWFLLAGGLSVVVAHALHVTVERRGMLFAASLKPARPPRDDAREDIEPSLSLGVLGDAQGLRNAS